MILIIIIIINFLAFYFIFTKSKILKIKTLLYVHEMFSQKLSLYKQLFNKKLIGLGKFWIKYKITIFITTPKLM